jgi:peptidoglycan/LPS O-acetylase OafA/YrhL
MQRDGVGYYRPELDVLRFLAFLFVFLHHAFPSEASAYSAFGEMPANIISSLVVAGGLGVDLFFVLSAFLITKLLLIEEQRTDRLDVPSFLTRRALRIWPLYFAFLFASVYLIPHLLPGPGEDLGQHFYWFLAFLGNWACVLYGYPPSVAAPLWSVSVEEQFYLAWPIVLIAVGTRRIVPVACSLLLLACAVRVVLWLKGAPHTAVWANTFARLDPIAVGILLAWLSERRPLTITSRWRLALAMVGLILPPAAIFILGKDAFHGSGSLALYPVVALGGGLLVFAVAFSPGSRSRWITNRALIHLGRVSYGLYVFHVLAIHIVMRYGDRYVPSLWRIEEGLLRTAAHAGLGLLLTVALAVVSYQFLERPFLKLKQRFTAVRSAPV